MYRYQMSGESIYISAAARGCTVEYAILMAPQFVEERFSIHSARTSDCSYSRHIVRRCMIDRSLRGTHRSRDQRASLPFIQPSARHPCSGIFSVHSSRLVFLHVSVWYHSWSYKAQSVPSGHVSPLSSSCPISCGFESVNGCISR